MINRVLIRMKAVQLLYSYLLVEKPFELESLPSNPTKEKRFAYGLYLDMVYLICNLANTIQGKNKTYPLSDSRFVLKSEKQDQLLSLKKKYDEGNFPFSKEEDALRQNIRESLLFKEYEKGREEGNTRENFWEPVFNNIIMADPGINARIKTLPNYTLAGVERMKVMMEDTFKNFYSTGDSLDTALRTLKRSLEKARDLYMRLLALPVELTRLRSDQLETNRRKYLASSEDINPNMKFVENRVAKEIAANPDFDKYTDLNHLSWRSEDSELLDILLKEIINSDIYKKYIGSEDRSIKEDVDFWRDVLVEVILNSRAFLEYLEEKSVFWNDDLEIMASFVLKTFKRFESEDTRNVAVLPMYKDGEDGKDARFGSELFRYVIRNKDLYKKYIDEALAKDKWEADRLAFMDVVITMTALAEIINYPEIPLTVSINEYIEIAKSYSSAKSGQFIHGLLASLVSRLKEKGIITK